MATIAEKIAKIIAKADSTTSQTEAETFMAKAQAMMEEHGLSLLDLGRLDAEDPIGHTDRAYVSSDGWKDKVAGQLATYFGCKIVRDQITKTSYAYVVFGRESARVTFSLMLPYVLKQVAKMALDEHAAEHYPPARARSALANATAIRLFRLAKDNREATEASRGTAGLNALVPVDLIDAEIAAVYRGGLKSSRANYATDANARAKAERISLHRQTAAPSNAKRLA